MKKVVSQYLCVKLPEVTQEHTEDFLNNYLLESNGS